MTNEKFIDKLNQKINHRANLFHYDQDTRAIFTFPSKSKEMEINN